jgi:hypothetical protein
MSIGARVVAAAVVAALCLVGAYLALGGTSFSPTAVANPCEPRTPPTNDAATSEALQRVVLSAADTVACEIGTTREDLVLALRSPDRLEQLAREEGVDRGELERSVRAGLVSAADQAEREGLLGERTADLVRAAARRFPLSLLLTLLRGVDALLD